MSGYAERVLSFGCVGQALQGIVSEPPAGRPRSGQAVIIIVGGPQYRAGSHRQFVLLARALAAAGHVVLRFDYRGMGDSEGPQRDFQAVDADVAAAIDALLADGPGLRGLALWGLCDGASAALLYLHARADPRVTGLCLLNPWVRSEASLARTQVRHYYGQRLLQKDFWLKFLRGGVATKALRELLGNLRLARGSNTGTMAGSSYQQRMLEAWKDFAGPVLLLLSGDDYVAKEFVDHALTPAWRQCLSRPTLRRHELAGVDHTFSNASARRQVEELTLQWLAQACT
ncbi:hydrolase 1, exosortase A system-associated [Roseateles violae]|uniref:Hydrolase 1, exosortase A system-associated n=1 Tax=Roseateles violae TaxID=3058042 RepID=A0ABT8DQ59_9BURK|nr:hydrolase 1, exosortase A system-associated [Pelomonas sp. PFR6]MDN3920480.1 hydrolase 1, exosortase A system-associated [Pelomonas sp. PFR6]